MPLCETKTSVLLPPSAVVALPEGVPPLRSFYLYLTSGCNLACRHCWIKPHFVNGKPDPRECIDVEMLLAAVNEAKTLGLVNCKLTGGEPLFHPRFREIATGLSAMGINMNMETNGVLLTPAMARFLKNETNVYFASVSIDYDNPDLHDAFRGVQGSFKDALGGLDALAQAGYNNTQVIMSVHKGNVEQIDGVVALAEAHGAVSVKFNPVTDNGRGKQMTQRRETLTIPELLALEKYVYGELKEKSKIKKLILNLPPAIRSLKVLMETKGSTGDCGVISVLGILGTGEIAMCGIGQTIPSLVYGKLGDSITEIWVNHPRLKLLRDDLADRKNYPGICGDCLLSRICRTGCVANNYDGGGGMVWPGKQCTEAARMGLFPESRRRKIRNEDKGER
jgi:SynChlorMet cassette radical SAM/SPASM protein ScmF